MSELFCFTIQQQQKRIPYASRNWDHKFPTGAVHPYEPLQSAEH